MRVRFVLPQRYQTGPQSIRDIDYESDYIPRIGEIVEIDQEITKGEVLSVTARVSDITNCFGVNAKVIVYLK